MTLFRALIVNTPVYFKSRHDISKCQLTLAVAPSHRDHRWVRDIVMTNWLWHCLYSPAMPRRNVDFTKWFKIFYTQHGFQRSLGRCLQIGKSVSSGSMIRFGVQWIHSIIFKIQIPYFFVKNVRTLRFLQARSVRAKISQGCLDIFEPSVFIQTDSSAKN